MDKTFNYMMLSRLKMDCDYYLGYGGRCPNHCLWAKDEQEQIDEMKRIYNLFEADEKTRVVNIR